jgi:hypothetical protein
MAREHPSLRLRSDRQTSPLLRSMLREAGASVPTDADVDRLSARVVAAVAAGLPGPDLTVTPKHTFGSLTASKTVMLVGGALALGTTVGAIWTLRNNHSAATPPPAALSAPTPAAPSGGAEMVQPEPSASPLSAKETETKPSVLTPSGTGAKVTDAKTSALSEVALLRLARSELSADPRHALALTDEHRRRFPGGALTQEREVIAILALSQLGQTESAKKRGLEFEQHYPGSAHQPKIEQIIRGK